MTKSLRRSRNTSSSQIESLVILLQRMREIQVRVAKDKTLSKYLQRRTRIEDASELLENLFLRFHSVTRQLSKRHENRSTLEVNDEHDVQDLLHSLLRIYFDDIRREEWTPSYAGGSSRMDFLLKKEQIVIEVKRAREGLNEKELGEQLLVDRSKYQKHPDCRMLYCLVYDPEERIFNPQGIERDLSEKTGEFETKVFIVPRKM